MTGRTTVVIAFILTLHFLCPTAHSAVWYVDKDNTGTQNGTSWATAYTTIQPAVDAAFTAGGGDVWVAEGTYTSTSDPVVTMKELVHMYGGFVGSEVASSERNSTTHISLIDGENARHCVIGANNGTLDGFTITRGYTSGSGDLVNGGGMRNISVAPTIANCIFKNNVATGIGGAIYNDKTGASPTISDCIFEGNSAGATYGGGAIFNNVNSTANITRCVFRDNSSGHDAGAVYNYTANVVITNCVFSGNQSTTDGGALANLVSSNCSVINCTFFGNSAGGTYPGDAICNYATLTVKNSVFWNNDNQPIASPTGTATVTYSNVQGGYTGTGNINSDPLFIDSANNDFRLQSSSPCKDTGTATGAPATDILGISRPQGSGVDMGAYEYTTFALTTNVTGLGAVNASPTPGPYANGSSVALTATPSPGYRFDHWESDLTGNDNPAAITMDTDKTVTAVFSALQAGESATIADIIFHWCPAGTFMMGSPETETDRNGDEGPQHLVTLTQGFWMSETEVTQAVWTAVMGSNPSAFSGDMSRPVETVSWDDICATTTGFLDRLGDGFRLPTEAEWEYACRAGTEERFYWGDDPDYTLIAEYAWYKINSSNVTHPVGQKKANAWGLKDMSGNVHEWCADWYGAYSGVAATDPTGAGTGTTRLLRGGSWDGNSLLKYYRSAYRISDHPYDAWSPYGFRLALSESAAPLLRRLVFTATPEDAGTVVHTKYYSDGDAVPLTATPSPGWRFDHWEGDLTGSENPATITMDADKTVTAVFLGWYADYDFSTRGVRGYWPFDGNANDYSGNSYNGTAFGATSAAGLFGSAYSFNGSSDYISCGAPDYPEGSLTISTWVKIPEDVHEGTIMARTRAGNGNPYDDPYAVRIVNTSSPEHAGTSSFSVDSGLEDGPGLYGATNVCDDTWRHLAFVYDQDADKMSIYVDGTLDTTRHSVDQMGDWTTVPLLIGAGPLVTTGQELFFTGIMDEVVLFDRPLSYSEIQDLAADTNTNGKPDFWETEYVTLVTTTTGSGSIQTSPDGNAYPKDSSVTLTAIPSSGWLFDHWEGDVTGTENSTNITMDADKSVTAIFTPATLPTPEMVSIPANTFSMGRSEVGDDATAGLADELLRHDVAQPAYQIGKYVVTNAEYASVLNWALANGRLTENGGLPYVGGADIYSAGFPVLELTRDGDWRYSAIAFNGSYFVVDTRDGIDQNAYPVVNVTWYGAAMYCNWLSEIAGATPCYTPGSWACANTGNSYRLPRESEWECAAGWNLATDTHKVYGFNADTIASTRANYGGNNPLGFSGVPYLTPVGYYDGTNGTVDSPSPSGCYDMSGNVWQWCQDWYHADYTDAPTNGAAWESPSTTQRVQRGGCWSDPETTCRSARRGKDLPGNRYTFAGFRVALSPTFTLGTSVFPANSGMVTGAGDYVSGTIASLTAIPAEGWLFLRWEGDLTDFANPGEVNMTANKSVVAIFEETPAEGAPLEGQSVDYAALGVVAYWPFDDNANDVSGNGLNADVYGPTYADGRFGRCLSFDGDMDYLSPHDNTLLNGAAAFSISFWVKTAYSTAPTRIVGRHYSDVSGSWALMLGPTPDQAIVVNNQGMETTGGASVTDGTFHHVCTVFNGTYLRLYVDGDLISEKAATGPVKTSNQYLIIGCLSDRTADAPSTDPTHRYYDYQGLMDDLALFDRALEPSEILSLASDENANGQCDFWESLPPAEGQPVEGQPVEGQPVEGQPVEGQPAEGQPAEGQPAEGQPAEGQPVEGQPAEGQPAEGQPVEGQPAEGQPAEGQPAEGQPVEGQPAEGQPAEGQPVEGQPVEGQPVEGQPAEGQPVEGQPVEGQPAEGQPAEGQPVEGQPAEGQPAEGQPAEGAPVDTPPTASFEVSATSGYLPMTVQFTDTSTPGSAPITSWLWDFDDATTSTEQNPTHIYRHIPGIYSVTLTVSTSVGEDTVTRSSLILVTQYVPDVTGLLRAEAESLLSAAGISVGAVTEEWSTTISTGRVIRQVVPEDQGEEMINTLDLVISLGKVMDVYRYGDVNMKDGITSADYAAMIRAQSSTDPVVRALADVTHDGVVDSEDTQLLLRYLRSGGFVNATVRRLMAQAGANEVFLLWAPVPHDNVAGYRVYRSMDTAEPRTWIRMNEGENTPDTVFTDGTVESTTYFYRVSFVDILGNESGNSAPVEVVANTIIMSLPKIWGEAGDLVRVPVNLGNARGLTPKDIFVALQYDTDWATYVEVKPTPLTTAVDFLADATLPGLVNIMSQDTNNSLPGGEGRFFDLYLTLKSNPPNTCSDLLFGGDTVLTDSLGANIALKLNPGKLCIGAGTWGDLDGSGDVTEADAMIALEIAVEKLSLDPDDERNLFGDLNGDSMIDAADAVMILRMARDLSINPEANAKGDTKQITPRALMLDQVSAAKGCIATLPVALDDISALAGMDLVVSFPREDLECVGVRTTEATADFKVDSQIAAGYARISLSDAQALGSGAADVLELDFRVTGEVTTTDKPAPIVKLNYAELKGELGESFRWYADVAKTNGLVTILPAADCPVEPEGEPEGQTEGAIEGQASDGQVNDGETPEGLAVEGQPLEGESVDGETVDGEIVDGEPATAQPSSKEGQAPLNDIPIPSIKGCFACAI